MKALDCQLLEYSDSAFTNPHEVVSPTQPEDRQGRFTHMGAQYWGFETSRHVGTRLLGDGQGFIFDPNASHFFKLGLVQTSEVSRITVSTAWFTGNQVPAISIVLIHGDEQHTVIERQTLEPNQEHSFDITSTVSDTCLVLCHQEGGIANVRLFGEPLTPEDNPPPENLLEQAKISWVSNDHYGHPKDAVSGNRGVDHMKGWESARTGFGEQAVFSFKRPVTLTAFVVDTYLHRLNAPLSCHVFALPPGENLDQAMSAPPRWSLIQADGTTLVPDDFQQTLQSHRQQPGSGDASSALTIRLHPGSAVWCPVLPFEALKPDTYHSFTALDYLGPVAHLLFMHYPNGGIHGLKAFGHYLD